jgi:hypothetical protein
MSNVIDLRVITKLDVSAEKVLNAALEAKMNAVVVIGWDEDNEFYFASSKADKGKILWLLEMAKKELMDVEEI